MQVEHGMSDVESEGIEKIDEVGSTANNNENKNNGENAGIAYYYMYTSFAISK